MFFIDNKNEHDPAVNLALEEYSLRNLHPDADLLLFYINSPSIIIGKHQNTFDEINHDYVEQQGIQVVRRLSGGGAVYHDLGNLNFSFITKASPGNFRNFKKFTDPIVKALLLLGIPAELNGRNDLTVDGRKVSGNAQYISRDRMVSHGTLLFNSDLSRVGDALNVHESKITSKGIKSVRSRVANISEFLTRPMSTDQFRNYLLEKIFDSAARIPTVPLSAEDWSAVHRLADERYRSWDWNYGRSPDFNIEKRQRFPGGEIDARLNVQDGVICSVKFFGDFFAENEPEEIERLFAGVRYDRDEIDRVLRHMDIEKYFSGIDLQTFSKFLL